MTIRDLIECKIEVYSYSSEGVIWLYFQAFFKRPDDYTYVIYRKLDRKYEGVVYYEDNCLKIKDL